MRYCNCLIHSWGVEITPVGYSHSIWQCQHIWCQAAASPHPPSGIPLSLFVGKREHHTYLAQWSSPYAWELATEQFWSVTNHFNNISDISEQCFSLLTWLPVRGTVFVCIGSLYDTASLFLSLQSSLSSTSTTPSVQFWELLELKHTQLSFVNDNYPSNKQTILVFYSGRYTHELFCLNIVRRGKLWLETRHAPSLVMTSLCFLVPFPKKYVDNPPEPYQQGRVLPVFSTFEVTINFYHC